MNADRILAETFADHEQLAPDADATWAAIAARLEPRPRRRAVAMVAAAAAVIAVVAGGTVLLRDRPATSPAPPVASPTSAGPATGGLPTVSIGADWLPPGAVLVGGQAGTVRERLDYRAGAYREISFGISRIEKFAAARVTPGLVVHGSRAYEEVRGGDYFLQFAGPGGDEVMLVMKAPGRPDAEIVGTGRRIAASLRFDRAEPLPMPFVLTYRPASRVVQVASWHGSEGDFYWLAPRGSAPTDDADVITVLVAPGPWKSSPFSKGRGPAVAGRPVQGHPSWVIRDDQTQTLWVDNLWGGSSLYINGWQASLEDLYRIAEGARQR